MSHFGLWREKMPRRKKEQLRKFSEEAGTNQPFAEETRRRVIIVKQLLVFVDGRSDIANHILSV